MERGCKPLRLLLHQWSSALYHLPTFSQMKMLLALGSRLFNPNSDSSRYTLCRDASAAASIAFHLSFLFPFFKLYIVDPVFTELELHYFVR